MTSHRPTPTAGVRHLRWPASRLLLWCLLPALFSLAPAAERMKKTFNIPADIADKSLKQFAAQAGLEVLFSPKSTVHVRTNPVKGDYAPQEAIEQMLSGTALVATHDEKSGAFTVSLAPDPRVEKAAEDSRPASEKKKMILSKLCQSP